MTALNIRKNLGNLLYLAGDVISNAKKPDLKTIDSTVKDARRRLAKAISPDYI